MKKVFMSLMAVLVIALAAGLSSCSEKVESQIFDLGYDAGDLGDGTAMLYERTYKPIIIQALSKVAQPVTESGTTFMINTTPTPAKKAMQEAFEQGTAAAQKTAGDESLLKGLKVTLEYSSGSNPQKVMLSEYIFK